MGHYSRRRRLRLLRGRRRLRQVDPVARPWASGWRREGYGVRLTFEPGDTEVGRILRDIVLSPSTGELSDRTESLLYAADKAEHIRQVVQPALDRGEVVITDRYVDSMLAYQGVGRPLELAEVEHVARWATHDLRPHLTVVLDLEASHGLGRFEERDRIEGESVEFHERVRQAYLGFAAARPRPLPRRRRPPPRGRHRGHHPGGGAPAPRPGQEAMSVLDNLVGQARAVEAMKAAASGQGMSHAWLFTGPPGSGRSNAAIALAAALAVRAGGLRRVPRLPHRAGRHPRRRHRRAHREALHRRRRGPRPGPPLGARARWAGAGR